MQENKKAAPLTDLLVRSIRITDGSFTFIDRMPTEELIIPFDQIDFHTTNLSFDKPFEFQLDGSLWADRKNIHLRGEAQIDGSRGQVRFDGVKMETDLAQLLLRETPWHSLLSESAGIVGNLDGMLSLTAKEVIVSRGGLSSLLLDGQLTNGRAKFKYLKAPFEDIQVSFNATESNMEIRQMSSNCALGRISLKGRLNNYLEEQLYTADLSVEDLQVSELIPQKALPVIGDAGKAILIEGRLYGDFSLEGNGLSPQMLRTSLKADGLLEVREGKIRNLNLLRFVLDKISFIPNLADKIEQNLPPRYQDKIARTETILEKVVLDARIQQGALIFEDASLDADGFLISANGNLDFDQNLVLSADFYIPEDLSASMVESAYEISFLLDQKGRRTYCY